eukprot:TRINITY_DN1956_c0_g1_i1.p1 TRINITY_DN1956_c0_g1~~TRINITY_DN1956_c0_g1_i1.p1  ORF type:complete len:167 (+),score=24.50 TRINITY_DN1956_c0_g1_i1:322-822(+)
MVSNATDEEEACLQSSCSIPVVTIIHRKKERARDEDPKKYFEFEWVNTLTLSQRYTEFTSARFQIADLTFGPLTSNKIKKLAKITLKPFYKPVPVRNIATLVKTEDILTCLIERVEKIKDPALTAYHPHMAHSIPALILLKNLQRAWDENLRSIRLKNKTKEKFDI